MTELSKNIFNRILNQHLHKMSNEQWEMLLVKRIEIVSENSDDLLIENQMISIKQHRQMVAQMQADILKDVEYQLNIITQIQEVMFRITLLTADIAGYVKRTPEKQKLYQGTGKNRIYPFTRRDDLGVLSGYLVEFLSLLNKYHKSDLQEERRFISEGVKGVINGIEMLLSGNDDGECLREAVKSVNVGKGITDWMNMFKTPGPATDMILDHICMTVAGLKHNTDKTWREVSESYADDLYDRYERNDDLTGIEKRAYEQYICKWYKDGTVPDQVYKRIFTRKWHKKEIFEAKFSNNSLVSSNRNG